MTGKTGRIIQALVTGGFVAILVFALWNNDRALTALLVGLSVGVSVLGISAFAPKARKKLGEYNGR